MFKNTAFAVVLAFCLAFIGVPEVSATEYVNGILVEYYGNVGWWLQGMPDLVIFVSGVMFEDGTRSRTLTADDFDENGHCMVRFVKSRGVTTSVCHRTYIRQNGRLIYTND